jgi:hypothetical protein
LSPSLSFSVLTFFSLQVNELYYQGLGYSVRVEQEAAARAAAAPPAQAEVAASA